MHPHADAKKLLAKAQVSVAVGVDTCLDEHCTLVNYERKWTI